MRKILAALAFCSALTIAPTPATATTPQILYGNSAGSNAIHLIDPMTGVEIARYTPGTGNGRAIVTVGNTIYYTVTDDPHIYMLDATTGAPTGSITTTNASMSTLAWDGSHFWTADYSGTNRAFEIDPVSGANINTITLGNAEQYMDGLEYFDGKLIGNRCDACGVYDIYDLSGNVLTASFINTGGSATGIAYDGTNFLVSNIFNSSIGIYSGTTGTLLNTVNLTSNAGGFLIEDLSVDYAQRVDTGGGGVPEPSTWAMMLLGFGGIGFAVRRRKARRLQFRTA
jgi:PEP-CTERM motif